MTTPDPSPIRLRVLGPVSVEPPINGPRRLAVLVYLALARPRGLHSRDTLLALLWPESDQAGGRHALRNALHALRQVLGSDVILTSGDALVGVDPARIECDALALEADVAAGRHEDAIGRYHGEPLQGFHVSEAPEFERWLDGERRRLGDLIQQAAWSHAKALRAAGQSERAADAARRASALAPEDEISVRRLLRFLDEGGDRAAALRAYDEFAERLRGELDAEPSAETQALARSLREPPTTAEVEAAAPPSRAAAPPRPAMPAVVAVAPPISPSAADLAPTRRPSSRRPMLISTAALLGLIALTVVLRPRKTAAGGADPRLPIAVLPFDSEIADTALAYVAPALSESIADGLGISAAIPYDSSSALDRRDPGVLRARLAALGSRAAVRGDIRGGRDSLEVRLRVASLDGVVLGEARFRGSPRRVPALRDSVLAAIRVATGAMRPLAAAHVPDPQAAQLANNAEYLLGQRSVAQLRSALDMYDRALERDPAWPELWLGRSRTYGSLAYRHGMEYRAGMRASEHDAGEVLKRDPNDARAYMERAMARFHLGDLAGARSDAMLAEALDSTDAHTQSLIGTWWQWTGDHLDSALFYTRRADRLDPLARQTQLNILEIVRCMPDSNEVLRVADRVLEMDPSEPYALEVRAWTLTRFARWAEAANTYERRYPEYVRQGVTAKARKLPDERRFRGTVRALRQAVYADSGAAAAPGRLIEQRVSLFEDLGWRDSSIAALRSVVDSLEAHRTNMMCGENLRGFRRDPRVQAIVKRRGWTPGEFGRERP